MGTAWNTYDANKMSSGAMYGKTLAELGEKDPRIVTVTFNALHTECFNLFI